MKITQVLKTQVFIKLSEIQNLPVGFRITGASVSLYDMTNRNDTQAIILEGEIEGVGISVG
jgi:hypothetical protein